jgi:hypothetical protein
MTGRGRARRTYVAEEDGSVVGFATWARGVLYPATQTIWSIERGYGRKAVSQS